MADIADIKRLASESPALPPASKRQAVVRRSRKVCEHCHARKIECNILEVGTPCSNCACYKTACTLRKRKNQRRDPTPPAEGQDETDMSGSLHVRRASVLSLETTTPSTDGGIGLSRPGQLNSDVLQVHTPVVSDYVSPVGPIDSGQSWSSISQWSNNAAASNVVNLSDMTVDTTYDFSHLNDLDDIFAFTNDFTYDAVCRQLGPPFYTADPVQGQPHGPPAHTSLMVSAASELSPADE